jgi:hypothetical protein
MPSVLPALFRSKKFVVLLLTVLSVAFLSWNKTVTPAEAIHLLTFVIPTYFAAQGLADAGKEAAAAGFTSSSLEEEEEAFQASQALTGPATSDMTTPSSEEAPTSKPEEEITKPEVDPFPVTTSAPDTKKES